MELQVGELVHILSDLARTNFIVVLRTAVVRKAIGEVLLSEISIFRIFPLRFLRILLCSRVKICMVQKLKYPAYKGKTRKIEISDSKTSSIAVLR